MSNGNIYDIFLLFTESKIAKQNLSKTYINKTMRHKAEN